MPPGRYTAALAAALIAFPCALFAQSGKMQASVPADDIPPSFTAPVHEAPPARQVFDYIKRVVMVPMRDGTKLYTVIMIPKGAQHAPMVLTRTCYNAAARAAAQRTPGPVQVATQGPPQPPRPAVKQDSPHLFDELPLADEVFVEAGYIRVYQDVRGKYGSEGAYLMTPPPVDSGFNPTGADDTTDGYDTIDWLSKNVPESNGKVGMIGSSYEGFTVVMALLHPHPAFKVAAPESPMVDGWMGDDWFHYGAFRQTNLDYFLGQTTARGAGTRISHGGRDDYTNFLEHGSAGGMARFLGEDQLPFWHTVEQNAAYTPFWQSQALDRLLAKKAAKEQLVVPTMWLQGLWDQEDMWGAIHSYRALEPYDKDHTKNYLVMGPWFHSQVNREGHSLGPLYWDTDTTAQFRREVLLPFFNQYLKDGSPVANTPPVYIYNTGEDHWDELASWPLSCTGTCPDAPRPLYLAENGKLSFTAPTASTASFDEYISDPAKPVPFTPRPADGSNWRTWLVTDQRFVDGRPDVLTYTTEPLTQPMRVSGTPVVNLMASTSGTDSDWVVKVIDVYPPDAPNSGATVMSGYELPIATDIFRGRYRSSFSQPEALKPNNPESFSFDLPQVNHVFQPGHRIMVQVQSTLFPLYDRNPQTFVANIFDASPADYQKAIQRIWHKPGTASFITMPVVSRVTAPE